MEYCCAPLCQSKRLRRPPKSRIHSSISFHEFPNHEEIRKKWLSVFTRDDMYGPQWQPFDRSVVCSLHFCEGDFKQGKKRKFLFPESVPSIFVKREAEDYVEQDEQENGLPRDRVEREDPENTLPLVCGERESGFPHDYMERENGLPHDCEEQDENSQCKIESILNNEVIIGGPINDPFSAELPSPANSSESIEDVTSEGCDPKGSSRFKIDYYKYRFSNSQRQVRRMKRTIRSLREQNEQLSASKKMMEKTYENLNMDRVLQDVAENKPKALFLYEQLMSYDKRKPRWGDATLRHTVNLNRCSPAACRYIRKADLITLPSESSIKRYLRKFNFFDDMVDNTETIGEGSQIHSETKDCY